MIFCWKNSGLELHGALELKFLVEELDEGR